MAMRPSQDFGGIRERRTLPKSSAARPMRARMRISSDDNDDCDKIAAKLGESSDAIVIGGILAAKGGDQAGAHAAIELAFCWMSRPELAY